MNTRIPPVARYAAVLAIMLAGTATSYAQQLGQTALSATFKAHGGLEQWSRHQTFTYTLDGFPLSPQVAKPNSSTVDLRNRYNRIESDGYTVGFDGNQAWSTPGPDAVGLPPRFYSLGSFYFIGMPFVFGDPGVIIEDKGTGEFRGKTYRVVKVRYDAGIGHSAEDDYIVFLDPNTNRLALIHHSVTELPDVDRVTWVFDKWQQVNGLHVPAQMTFYAGWNPDNPGEGASFTIENANLSEQAPDPAIYSPLKGAVIDQAASSH